MVHKLSELIVSHLFGIRPSFGFFFFFFFEVKTTRIVLIRKNKVKRKDEISFKTKSIQPEPGV